jgi:hypothetical protein
VESNPHFLPDGKRIYFTRSNNLYVMSLDTGLLVEMTDIRAAAGRGSPAGAGGGRGGRGAAAAAATTGEQRGTDSQEYLKKEQKELLEVVRERSALREEQDKKRENDNPRKPFTLEARQSVAGLQLTPDEKYVMAAVTRPATPGTRWFRTMSPNRGTPKTSPGGPMSGTPSPPRGWPPSASKPAK